jgi:peptidoglycan/LPS O-acetylase OafA/YrhL
MRTEGHPADASRLDVLDGLRGLVLFIPLIHLRTFYSGETWAEQLYLYFGDLGLASLDMFFALSGFLITGILLDSRTSPSYYSVFYGRRVLRIVPLYYGFLFVYLVVLPHLVPALSTGLDPGPRGTATYWLYYLNWSIGFAGWSDHLLQPLHGTIPGTSHLWSLSVEEQFYLIWPLVVQKASRTTLKRICIACMLFAPAARVLVATTTGEWTNIMIYMITPTRMDGLALGAWLAVVAREPGGLERLRPLAWPVTLAGAGTLLALFVYYGHLPSLDAPIITLGLTASVYCGGGVVLVSLLSRPHSRWRRIFSSTPLRTIGQYSYAIYVFHYPVSYVMDVWHVLEHGAFAAAIPNRLAAELSFIGARVVIVVALGALSWHAYEKHFLGLRRYLGRTPQRDRQVVAAGIPTTSVP